MKAPRSLKKKQTPPVFTRIVVLLLTLLASPTFARIGDTRAQVDAKQAKLGYKIVSIDTTHKGTTVLYQKGKLFTMAVFDNGISVMEAFSTPDNVEEIRKTAGKLAGAYGGFWHPYQDSGAISTNGTVFIGAFQQLTKLPEKAPHNNVVWVVVTKSID